MRFDKIFDLTAGVYFYFYNIYSGVYIKKQKNRTPPIRKSYPQSILKVPTTQLAKMSIDPNFVELTADVLEIFLYNTNNNHYSEEKRNMYNTFFGICLAGKYVLETLRNYLSAGEFSFEILRKYLSGRQILF